MSCKKTTSTLWSGAGAGSLCRSAVHRHWLSSLHRCGGVKFSESDLCCFTHKTRGMTSMKSKGTKKKQQQNQKWQQKKRQKPGDIENTISQNDKNDQQNTEVGALGWESLRGAHGLAGRRANAVSVHAFLGLSPAAEPRHDGTCGNIP